MLPALLLPALLGCGGSQESSPLGPPLRKFTLDQAKKEEGRTYRLSFDAEASGSAPGRFSSQGGLWQIIEDEEAPSPPNVLAQLKSEDRAAAFPVAYVKDKVFADVLLSVKFRPSEESADPAAVLVLRLQDQSNYYAVEAGARDESVELYKVERGERLRLSGARAAVLPGVWQELEARMVGDSVTVLLNGGALFDAADNDFLAGRVGVGTKTGAATQFDDFTVRALSPAKR